MKDTDKRKICIVVQNLGSGGAERSTAMLSQLLEGLGHEVHLVTILNRVDYEYGGTLHNLGAMKDANDSFLARIKRFWYFMRFMRASNFDVVIDNRPRFVSFRESFYYFFLYPIPKTIFVVRSYAVHHYFPTWRWMIDYFYSRAKKVVCVSREIATTVQTKYGLDNVVALYNPVMPMKQGSTLPLKNPYILAYGRFEESVKNYTLLLEAYKRSILPEKGIGLVLMGDGPDLQLVKDKAKTLELTDTLRFPGFVPHPAGTVSRSLFVALTSRYEGFPRALIEALSLGVPVVSVDCSSGPKEIVKDGENGLLVPNHSMEKLAKAFNSMVTDTELYTRLKNNAKASVEHLKFEVIARQWQDLITEDEYTK